MKIANLSSITNYPKKPNSNMSFCANEKNLFAIKAKELTPEQKRAIIRLFQPNLHPWEEDGIMRYDWSYNEFIEKAQDMVSDETFFKYSGLAEETQEQVKKLIELGFSHSGALEALKLPKRELDKAIYLVKKKLNSKDAINLSKLPDEQFVHLVKLLKTNLSLGAACSLAGLEESEFQKIPNMLKKGVDYQGIRRYTDPKDKNYNNAQKHIALANQGISTQYLYIPLEKCEYEYRKLIEQGHGRAISAILAHKINRKGIEQEDVQEYIKAASMLDSVIRKNSIRTKKYMDELSNLTVSYYAEPIQKLAQYASKIDFNRLKEIAPHMTRYTSEELITFIKWHFENGTTRFNKETLDLGDLTEYLQNNFTESLRELLIAHPLTRREVGKVPNEWFTNVWNKEETTKQIYKAIKSFQGRRNIKEFEKELTSLLNKEVKVEMLGKGLYGSGYKISIAGCKPVCLKLFHLNREYTPIKDNGVEFEVQAGLFLNKHSNQFVHMHFGKVAAYPMRDGFLVTQFIDENTQAIKNSYPSGQYYITYGDRKPENRINGTIIDYGGVSIEKKYSSYGYRW